MKPFVLGVDKKTCIWPIPRDCTWNSERFKLNRSLSLFFDREFTLEARWLKEKLGAECGIETDVTDGPAELTLMKCNEERIGSEGYSLHVSNDGITIRANTGIGVFYGIQTLLHLILNAPDPSISGVRIMDWPEETVREVPLSITRRAQIPRVKKWIDFLAKYKFNRIRLQTDPDAENGEQLTEDEKIDLIQYMADRHLVMSVDGRNPSNIDGFPFAEARDSGNPFEDSAIYAVLKASFRLWRSDREKVTQENVYMLPVYLEMIVAQLYPLERNRIIGAHFEGRYRVRYKYVNMRDHYNAPLYRLFGCNDDYDLLFLPDARNVPNNVPHRLFQGVDDFRFDFSLALASHTWEQEVTGIPVNAKANRLSFLHTCVMDRKKFCASSRKQPDIVGHYAIHYRDGSTERVNIVYGKTIYYWTTDLHPDSVACGANPVFVGTTYGKPYVIYAQDWINPRPDSEIDKIDVVSHDDIGQDGIAVLGITAVQLTAE